MSETLVQATFNIEPFDPSLNWATWLKRLEGAFKLFKVKNEDKVYYLLHHIGAAAFDVLSNKCMPKDPYDLTYNVLVENLREFYAPAPLEIAENFRFHQRRQQEDESMLQYVAALQKLSIDCKFGEYLNTALRNQFVYGLRSTRIQSRLLETKDLTFDKAVQLASGMEMSAKDTDQLQGAAAPVQTADAKKPQRRTDQRRPDQRRPLTNQHQPTKKTYGQRSTPTYTQPNHCNRPNLSGNKKVSCYRCGKGHLATQCTLNRNLQCAACGIHGHLQSVCFNQGY